SSPTCASSPAARSPAAAAPCCARPACAARRCSASTSGRIPADARALPAAFPARERAVRSIPAPGPPPPFLAALLRRTLSRSSAPARRARRPFADPLRSMPSVRSISVLMPTWQGEEFLERALEALAAQELSVPWDFLAIDSGSTDRTLAILEQRARRFPVPFAVQRI